MTGSPRYPFSDLTPTEVERLIACARAEQGPRHSEPCLRGFSGSVGSARPRSGRPATNRPSASEPTAEAQLSYPSHLTSRRPPWPRRPSSNLAPATHKHGVSTASPQPCRARGRHTGSTGPSGPPYIMLHSLDDRDAQGHRPRPKRDRVRSPTTPGMSGASTYRRTPSDVAGACRCAREALGSLRAIMRSTERPARTVAQSETPGRCVGAGLSGVRLRSAQPQAGQFVLVAIALSVGSAATAS